MFYRSQEKIKPSSMISISKDSTSLSLRATALAAGIAYLIAIPAFFSEFMLTLWLLIKGSRLKDNVEKV